MLNYLFKLRHKRRLYDFIFYLLRPKNKEEIEHERKENEELNKGKTLDKPTGKNNKSQFNVRYSISPGDYYTFNHENRKRRKDDEIQKEKVNKLINELMNDKTSVISFDEVRELTFVEMIRLYIKEKNLKDSEVYKAGQIDRRLFSKIINDIEYKPSKDTVLQCAFALKLSLFETKDLLERAGYTLSHSIKRDIIIEYFFKEKVYNIDKINSLLYNIKVKTIGRNID